jgi:hypothetical protein
MNGILIILILVACCAIAVYFRIKYPSKHGLE